MDWFVYDNICKSAMSLYLKWITRSYGFSRTNKSVSLVNQTTRLVSLQPYVVYLDYTL